MKLVLPAELKARLEDEAEAALPNECCGLLIGGRTDSVIQVQELVPSENLAADPAQTFEVDMRLRLRLQKELRDTDMSVIGHYHSHPNGRVGLSATDKSLAWEDQMVWLIIAVTTDDYILSADLYDAEAKVFQALLPEIEAG